MPPRIGTFKLRISELISSGWVIELDRVRDDAVRRLLERYPENAPRIVLTEGVRSHGRRTALRS